MVDKREDMEHLALIDAIISSLAQCYNPASTDVLANYVDGNWIAM